MSDLSPTAAEQIKFFQSISIVLEILGLVGTTMALGGVWIAGWKKRWLEGRLMTEKLRAWHFQMLIHRGRDIEASCNASDPQAVAKFQAKRATWFAAFLHHHRGKLDSQLHEVIDAPESCYTALHEPTTPYTDGNPTLDRVFEAYKALRLKHQADYAAHKLQRETNQPLWKPHKWPINVLKDRLRTVISFCLLGALAVSAYIVVGYFGHWPLAHSVALPAFILCLLVLNVATRGVMDGLAVREEAQRYTDYAGEVRYLLTKFEATHDRREKLQLMQEMERAAVEELKSFLRAHFEARFVV